MKPITTVEDAKICLSVSESMHTSLVRIRTIDGGIVGAGFLVGKCHVLTCAHVVAQALDLPEAHPDPPLTPVVLDFPLLAPHTRLAAKVVFWCPASDDGSGDIAGLELLGDPPEGAQMVRFAPAEDVWEHPFRAFGFPAGHDGGGWATGRLLGRQAYNWLMLEDVKTEGFPVTRGFSGSPVWDAQLQGVVGMVVASSRSTETKTAFVIPFDVLAATTVTWHCLQPITYQRIFLSVAPADMVFAERLRADLQEQGIVVWDEQHGLTDICPDADNHVRQAIRASQAVLLIDSPQARTSRTVSKHRYLADLYQRRLILVWIGNDKNTPVSSASRQDMVLVDAHSTPYEVVRRWVEAALSQHSLGVSEVESPRGDPRNPYKGLHPFTADDVGDFFGRQCLVSELVNDVASLLPAATSSSTDNERCLSIIGPSGSGKSSVVMAGLLPRLQQGALPDSERWVYLKPMLPGKHPIEALIQALKHHLPDISLKTLREDLEDDTTQGLHLLATQLVKESRSRVVLLVDQFEELFTQTETEDERQRFIDLLLAAVTMSGGPLLVLLTLRADFYDRPMQYPPLSRLMQAHQRQVLPMDVEDLRATIEQPAALPDVQLSFEGNLVGDLLFEVRGQIGALPLLQFALYQLFGKRDRRCLTRQAYHEIGGIKGALSQHAEQTYKALPSEEHRRLARALFLRLVEPGVSEQDTTRRRAALSEFNLPDHTQTRLMREVIDVFVTARLLTTSEVAGTTMLEVSHEAVLREWKRIAEWLHEARGDILIQQDLSKDTTEWEQHGKSRDRLYHGSQLKDVQAWAKRNSPSEQEAAFIRASAIQRIQLLVSLIVVGSLLVSLMGFVGINLFLHTLVITLSDNGEPGSLRWCIDNAPSGSTIKFAPWVRGTIKLTGGLSVGNDKTLTIEGPGADRVAISGGASISVPTGTTLTISGLSFKDSQMAAGAFLYNKGTLIVTNSVISNNKNLTGDIDYGGGIENLGVLIMTNSILSGNTVEGDNYQGRGGGIDNESVLTVRNSTFLNNKAVSRNGITSFGGGIFNAGAGTVTITNSTFSGNMASSSSAVSSGGGISNEGKLSVIDSTFLNNKAVGNSGASAGGGIGNEGKLSVTDSTFLNNIARNSSNNNSSYGGGISNDITGTLTVTHSTFSGNTVSNSNSDSQGGGISNDGQLSVTNSAFSDNEAVSSSGPSFGGGIDNTSEGTVTVTHSMFSGNMARNSSGASFGGGIYSNGKLSVTNSTFANNEAVSISGASFGGGISNVGMVTMVTHSTFSGNTASNSSGGSYGGGIDNGGKLSVTDSTFSNNKAISSSGAISFGGGIHNSGEGTVAVTNSTFSGNMASSSSASGGGGIGNGGKLSVTDSTFLNNSANSSNSTSLGGGIDIDQTDSTQTTLSNSIIAANSAHDGPDISGALTSGGYNLLTNVTGASGLSSTDKQVTLDDLKIEQTLGNNGGLSSTDKQVTLDDLKIEQTLGNNGGLTQTLKLLPGSVAIDAVPRQACRITITDAVSSQPIEITTDQRGDPRPGGSKNACDVGAYESSY